MLEIDDGERFCKLLVEYDLSEVEHAIRVVFCDKPRLPAAHKISHIQWVLERWRNGFAPSERVLLADKRLRCVNCGTTIEEDRPYHQQQDQSEGKDTCLACAGCGDLIYLPEGNGKVTTTARIY